MALQPAELTGQLLVQSRQLQQSYRIVGELSLVMQAYMEGNTHIQISAAAMYAACCC